MNYSLEKNLKIVDEIITFFYKEGLRDFDVKMNFNKEVSIFNITGIGKKISDKKIKYLNEVLNVERQPELEEQYWILGGDSNMTGECELSLVGMMVDKTEIKTDENDINIIITRNEK